MTPGEKLSDELLENVSGGATNEEIIAYIDTQMSTVPENSRKKIKNALIVKGVPGAAKMAIFVLNDDRKSRDSLLTYMGVGVK